MPIAKQYHHYIYKADPPEESGNRAVIEPGNRAEQPQAVTEVTVITSIVCRTTVA